MISIATGGIGGLAASYVAAKPGWWYPEWWMRARASSVCSHRLSLGCECRSEGKTAVGFVLHLKMGLKLYYTRNGSVSVGCRHFLA
jgi:hypothetical protein